MKKPLYIHLHIPKTAGYTFRYHVQKNLGEDEQLLLCYDPVGLNLFDPPSDPDIYKKAAFKLVKSLSKEKRDKIKIIHGHTVPFGIHELFDREPRYFTFVRNPVDRIVSLYNFYVQLFKVEGREKRKYPYYKEKLLLDGEIPSFQNWLKYKYEYDFKRIHLSMIGYLKEMGYLIGSLKSKKAINGALSKFYFTGLTRNFSDESLFFYSELGMHKFFIDQNISPKSFNKKISVGFYHEIIKRNRYGKFLFEKAVKYNMNFKKENPGIISTIRHKKLERFLLLPITQPLFAPRQTFLRFFKYAYKKESLNSDPTYFSGSLN